MRKFLMMAAVLGLLPVFAAAQRGGMAVAGHSAMAAHPASSAAVHPGTHGVTGARGTTSAAQVHRARINPGLGHNSDRTVSRSIHSSGFPGVFTFGNIPGLGFDFPHSAAINARGRMHLRGAGAFPFGGGGFFLAAPPVIVEEQETRAAENGDSAAGEQYSDEDANRAANLRERESYAPAERTAPPAPQHEVGEYVFVRRDGGLVFAVAYSWDSGTLRYVTREGMSHSIARDSLDLRATQQFNEQRGMTFTAPA